MNRIEAVKRPDEAAAGFAYLTARKEDSAVIFLYPLKIEQVLHLDRADLVLGRSFAFLTIK